MRYSKIAIIGLGLIGGSLARALNLRMGIKDIYAVDMNADAINQAVSEGILKAGYTEINETIFAADIIFLCTPVKKSIEYLGILSGRVSNECIITDVGSTKGELAAFIDTMKNPPCFIGGHPMAGSEKAGYTSGSAHLFENAYYVLTPCKCSDAHSIERMKKVIIGIGAIPIIMDAAEHDRVTGAISHVPHIIASALVNMVKVADKGDGIVKLLAAGGFRDITRIASSNPVMWENIVSSNKAPIHELLDSFTDILERCRIAVNSGNTAEILEFFNEAKSYRDSIPSVATGLIQPEFDLTVDVMDKPGIIGEIATLLGKNNINIKNINVSNSREFEQGCLRVTLYDMESANIGFDLLSATGYKVYMNI